MPRTDEASDRQPDSNPAESMSMSQGVSARRDVSADDSVRLADVQAAAERIAGGVERTPLAHSRTLSEITGAEIHVKYENLQFTASYKERGALNRLLRLDPAVGGVVAASAGNFAQGVAYHARRQGRSAVIVMPETTPSLKIARTEVLGAEVVCVGSTFEEASAAAHELAADRGYELLSPFDDLDVIAGQGTVGLEILEDLPDLDVLIVPVGGGGLLAGVAVAVRSQRPDIELVGVQSERFPAVHNALTGAEFPSGGATIAEGIAVAKPGVHTVALIRSLVDRVETVPEAEIEHAVAMFLEVEKSVIEGAGAAALAEVICNPDRYAGRKVGIVASGGNIDLRQLASVIMRSLVKSGRITTLWVEVDDRPGQLGAITTLIGQLGGNILDVEHRRLDPGVHARSSYVRFNVETTNAEHWERLLVGLEANGHRVSTAEQVRRPEPPRHT